jgi:hypothetical protein
MKNKKGQFFLIAALIIITVLLSFVTYRSRVKIVPVKEKVYDIGEELSLETAEIIDYGIYTGNTEDIDDIFQEWVEHFVEYKGDIGEDFIFIYSDPEGNVKGFRFNEQDVGDVTMTISGQAIGVPQEQGRLTEISGLRSGNIKIELGNFSTTIDYDPGERDFYFVIKSEGGEIVQA